MSSNTFPNPDSPRDRDSHLHHVDGLLPAFLNGSLDRFTAERVRVHLATCAACQMERQAWEAIRHASQASVATAPAPSPDLLSHVWDEIERDEVRRRLILVKNDHDSSPSFLERMTSMLQSERPSGRRSLLRPLSVAAAGVALVAVVALTPIGSYAQGFLTIFSPQQVAAVPVTQAELQSLPDLNNYGTFTQSSHGKSQSATTAAAASTAAGFAVVAPAYLPASVTGAPSYEVMGSQSASFTFSAAKAKATAAKNGQPLPTMPANIDGSTIQVASGSAVLTTYGGGTAASSKVDPTVIANLKAKEAAKAGSVQSADALNVPSLMIGQTTAPTVTSTGASAAELETYLLAQPGISPGLASAIKAIGDPTTTLPIPIPVGQATSHPVQIQGVTGLSVADSTGIGGGIIWTKNGMVYGVAGTLTENDLIAVGNSLK